MLTGTLEPASNRAGFSLIVELLDDDTGDAVDLTGASIVFEVSDNSSSVLSATTSNAKVTIVDTGIFKVDFTATEMRALCAKTYTLGCTVSNADSEPQQLIIGFLPVLDGIVS